MAVKKIGEKVLDEIDIILQILKKNTRLRDRVFKRMEELQINSKETVFDSVKKPKKK